MYNVLIALDNDETRALAQADAVASLPGADGDLEATLLHVFTDNPEGASIHQLAAVRQARDRLEDAGVEVSLLEESGEPSKAVIRRAGEIDADLISVAGRQRTPAGKALLGSVSQEVLLNADRPVLFSTVEEGGE